MGRQNRQLALREFRTRCQGCNVYFVASDVHCVCRLNADGAFVAVAGNGGQFTDGKHAIRSITEPIT